MRCRSSPDYDTKRQVHQIARIHVAVARTNYDQTGDFTVESLSRLVWRWKADWWNRKNGRRCVLWNRSICIRGGTDCSYYMQHTRGWTFEGHLRRPTLEMSHSFGDRDTSYAWNSRLGRNSQTAPRYSPSKNERAFKQKEKLQTLLPCSSYIEQRRGPLSTWRRHSFISSARGSEFAV